MCSVASVARGNASPCVACSTFLGCESTLGNDPNARIAKFLGIPDVETATVPEFLPATQSLDAFPTGMRDDLLRWEAFFVRCLGVKLPKLLDQICAGFVDLCLHVGRHLDEPTAKENSGSIWRYLLQPEVPRIVKEHIETVITGTPQDIDLLAGVPVRTSGFDIVSLGDMFLHQTFQDVAGKALMGLYFDCPELAHGRVSGNSGAATLLKCIRALGVHCEVDVRGLLKILRTLQTRPDRPADITIHAKLYAAIAEYGSSHGLLEVVHHPTLGYVPTPSCVWAESDCDPLFMFCAGRVDLAAVYDEGVAALAGTHQSSLKRCFVQILGVDCWPNAMSTPCENIYYETLENLVDLADKFGRLIRLCLGHTLKVPVLESIAPGKAYVQWNDFLSNAWKVLLSIYRGIAGLPPEQREPSIAKCIVLPLRCHEGGPPEIMSFSRVALQHNGAVFRRLAPREAYWDVDVELAYAPAAEWALSQFFPADLRDFFVDDLGVQATLDRDGLHRRLQALVREERRGRPGSRAVGATLPAGPTFDFDELVNESGLSASDLGGDGGAHAADPLLGAREVLQALRRTANHRPGGLERDSNAICIPARHARNVHIRAMPARQLLPQGMSGGACSLPVVALESEASRAQALTRTHSLSPFANLLGALATEVFALPLGCVAIVVAPNAPSCEDCWHTGTCPLLFSWDLYLRRPETAFWLGEFCHGLAHLVVGAGHLGNSHALVMNELLSQYLPVFVRTFGTTDEVQANSTGNTVSRRRRRRVVDEDESEVF